MRPSAHRAGVHAGWLGIALAASFAFGSLAGRTARAEPSAPAAAVELFARGRSLRSAGDCAAAIPVFRRAYEVYPDGLGSLRNIAECEESLGDLEAARRAWQDLRRALATHPEPKYEGWDFDADRGLGRTAAKPTDATSATSPAAAPPATHAAPATPAFQAEEKHRSSALSVAAPIALGIGAAGVAGTVVALVLRQQAMDDLQRACSPGSIASCPQGSNVAPIEERGHAASAWATVFGVVGVLGLGAGAVLFATGSSRGGVAIVAAPDHIGAVGRF